MVVRRVRRRGVARAVRMAVAVGLRGRGGRGEEGCAAQRAGCMRRMWGDGV